MAARPFGEYSNDVTAHQVVKRHFKRPAVVNLTPYRESTQKAQEQTEKRDPEKLFFGHKVNPPRKRRPEYHRIPVALVVRNYDDRSLARQVRRPFHLPAAQEQEQNFA